MPVRVEHDDMLRAIPRLVAEGVVCDAAVTDPPYHLTATQKRFGAADSALAQYGRDGAMKRLSGGFMGQQWDGGDIAFRPETWAAVATALRPGAFLLAFGGTRTYHRLVCAIEDSGFVIQDCIMWLFGTGFPKRRDMLKPAYEPVCVAYKPGGKRTMQIDECRIAGDASPAMARRETARRTGNAPGRPGEYGNTIVNRITAEAYIAAHDGEQLGRWPANVCHDGSEEVLELFPMTESTPSRIKHDDGESTPNGIYGSFKARDPIAGFEDQGSAARFFYSAKADRQDRWGSRHPTVKPVELVRWLVKLVCPPDGLFLDPFAGSGTAAVAALAEGRNAILIEREETYAADIRERIAFYEGDGRHSLASRNRHAPEGIGALRDGGRTAAVSQGRSRLPLFEQPYSEAADCAASYEAAVRAVGERVKAGEPLPDFFRPSSIKL